MSAAWQGGFKAGSVRAERFNQDPDGTQHQNAFWWCPMFAALIGLFLLDSVAAQHGLGGLPPLILGWILISIGGYEAAQLLRSSGLAADRFLIPIRRLSS